MKHYVVESSRLHYKYEVDALTDGMQIKMHLKQLYVMYKGQIQLSQLQLKK